MIHSTSNVVSPLYISISCSIFSFVTDKSCTNNNPEDIIDQVTTADAEQCLALCQSQQQCSHFLWFDDQAPLPDYCYLYQSDCGELTACFHCQSGALQCLYPPTSTTTVEPPTTTEEPTTTAEATTTVEPPTTTIITTPTTTETVLPAECSEYLIMDDASRNNNHGDEGYCDDNDGHPTSPDWQGGRKWYRMLPPAGVVMPETSLERNHCGTRFPGWIRGSHPIHAGENKQVDVCFSREYDGNGDDCHIYLNNKLQITKCDNFYVYFLPETQDCNLRYCAAENF